VALLNYVRGVGVIHVALVRAMDETVIREGWMETVSWWRPSELERVMRTPAGWAAEAAGARTALEKGTDSPPHHEKAEKPSAEVSPSRRASDQPSSVMTVAAIGRRMVSLAENLFVHDDWNVGILDKSIDSLLTSPNAAPVTWLPVPTGHFGADPFGVERDGVLHVFYEDFDQRRAIGSIHHIAIGVDGRASVPEPVLEPGMHASYPFIVEHEGATFMLPEVSASGDLVLFEATHFPNGWRPVATLLPGIPAVDASVIHFEDRWWMFSCRSDHGANQDLFIWHAPDLFGPWAAHPRNPVKTDARSSRPGGTPFVSNGTLYRPSQDDSKGYGGRLVINEVVALTPTNFSERPVQVIRPDPGSSQPDGLHTMSAVGGRTLIDGNRRHFVSDAFRYQLARHVGSVRHRVVAG
jgi:hypothetical protein